MPANEIRYDIHRLFEASRANVIAALVGYSQGGMVVSSAAPKIPAALQPKVVAMVLYGAGKGPAGEIRQKTMANCAPGDMVSFYENLRLVWVLVSNASVVW